MAERQNLPNGDIQFTFSISEMLALRSIIGKISRDKSLTELWEYVQAGNFVQLFDAERESGKYPIRHI